MDVVVGFLRPAAANPLRAVLLVVDELAKGPLLVFQYPTPVKSRVSGSEDGAAVAGTSSSDQFFVRLFVPKPLLCGRAFEVEIDGLSFVSHPMPLPPGSSSVIRFFNVVFVLDLAVPLRQRLSPSAPTALAAPLAAGVSGFRGLPASVLRKAGAGAGAGAGSSSSRGLGNGGGGAGGEGSAGGSSFGQKRRRAATTGVDAGDTPQVSELYKSVAGQVAHALLHEEQRCGYVSEQVRVMLNVLEELYRQQASGQSFDVGRAFVSGALKRASLARELRAIFDNMSTTSSVRVRVNDFVMLATSLADPVTRERASRLRPYHTLVLTHDADDLLRQLPEDSSPQIMAVIKCANPLKNFHDMQTETGMPLDQILRLAAHLHFWRKAIIMTHITRNSILKTSRWAPLSPSNPVAVAFSAKFPKETYAKVLAMFSEPQRLHRHLQRQSTSAQRDFIRMLIWLLRHRCLVQLQTYVDIILPDKTAAAPGGGDGDGGRPRSGSATWSRAGATATSGERQTLHADVMNYVRRHVPADPSLYRLLARLLPYFTGTNPLEEIMWCERLRRARLQTLLNHFRVVLCCSQREEW